MARVGGVNLPVTLDTGADITLLPAELGNESDKTGRTAIVKGVWDQPRAAPVAKVQLAVGETQLQVTAAMVPGAQLGWEGTLAFNLDDPNQLELLGRLNQMRKDKYGVDDRRYIR